MVLCDQPLTLGIRRFFSQKWVLEQCRLGGDECLLGLNVIICEQPPRPLASLYRVRAKTALLSQIYAAGASVEIFNNDNSVIASLGGLVFARMLGGETALFGMTAGHLFGDVSLHDNGSACLNGEIGAIVKICREYDWALIDIEASTGIPTMSDMPNKPFEGEMSDAISRGIEVLREEPTTRGMLTSTSFIILPFATKPIKVFDVLPDFGGGLHSLFVL